MTKIKNFFKSITNSKKKIFALALSVCVVVLSIAGSSIAYFTDTAEYTNTFTSGKVDITLTLNGEDVDANDFTDPEDKAVPGTSIPKATVINVVNDSEDAYLGAVIEVTAPTSLGLTYETVKGLFTDLPTSGVTVTSTLTATDVTFKINVVFAGEYSLEDSGTSSATVFTAVAIPGGWTNEQMSEIDDLSIDVRAYAVQSEGLDDAASALVAAFPDEF